MATEPGASIPPTTMALFLPFSRLPLLHPPYATPTPRKQFLDIVYAILRNLCVFSVNFGSCQSGIMTPQLNKKYVNGVGKAHCMLSFLSDGVKRNRVNAASEKIFEKNDRKTLNY